MQPGRLWLVLALALGLLAPRLPVHAQEKAPEAPDAPDAGGADSAAESPPAFQRREPAQVWNEMLVARDQIHYYTEQEELMRPVIEEQKRQGKRRNDAARLVEVQRALTFTTIVVANLIVAARSGVPGRVRDLYPDLDHALEVIQAWVPPQYLESAAPAHPGP